MTVLPEDTVGELVRSLLAQREPGGGWHGHLSESARATAISATALHLYSPEENIKSVASAVQWLEAHTNSDGGVQSHRWGINVSRCKKLPLKYLSSGRDII